MNPTHFAHVVRAALAEPPRSRWCGIPAGTTAWRPSGPWRGKVEIYLPDLKYTSSETAARYSDAPDYPEVAKAAILEMFRQTGPCVYDEDGL